MFSLEDFSEYWLNEDHRRCGRLLFVSESEVWTRIHQFYKDIGAEILSFSALASTHLQDWFPAPNRMIDDWLFSELKKRDGAFLVVGLSGYLELLNEDLMRKALGNLGQWIGKVRSQEKAFLLQNTPQSRHIIESLDAGSRYLIGKQCLFFTPTPGATPLQEKGDISFVANRYQSLLPESSLNLGQYLQEREKNPTERLKAVLCLEIQTRRLVAARDDIVQIFTVQDVAKHFYSIEDSHLSEASLRRMCEIGAKNPKKQLIETFFQKFFPEGNVRKTFLSAITTCQDDSDFEILLWVVRHYAPKKTYLSFILQNGEAKSIRSAYITQFQNCLDHLDWAEERKRAIEFSGGVNQYKVDIKTCIEDSQEIPTAKMAPWLCCGSLAEKAELLLRCEKDGYVSHVVKKVYPELDAYLKPFPDDILTDELVKYFQQYREIVLTKNLTQEFCDFAGKINVSLSIPSRDTLLQEYSHKKDYALLVVDAMGAEWLPLLLDFANKKHILVKSVSIARAWLPTITEYNKITFDEYRRKNDFKGFDNMAHDGLEKHERHTAEENMVKLIDLGKELFDNIQEYLADYKYMVVTADHGFSHLALLAQQKGLAKTLPCDNEPESSRYRRAGSGDCPDGMECDLNKTFWSVRGYNRLPKSGGWHGFAVHGGATPEERLVPVIVLTTQETVAPRVAKKPHKLITENSDFDL